MNSNKNKTLRARMSYLRKHSKLLLKPRESLLEVLRLRPPLERETMPALPSNGFLKQLILAK